MSEHKDKAEEAKHTTQSAEPPPYTEDLSALFVTIGIEAYGQFQEGKPFAEIFANLAPTLAVVAKAVDETRARRAAEQKKLDDEAERLHAEALKLQAEANKLQAETAGALEVNAMRDRELAQWQYDRDEYMRRRRAVILSSLQGGANAATALSNATAVLHDETSRQEEWETVHPRPTSERLPTPGVRYRSIDPNMRFVPVG